jgi:hypothetical protein
MKLKFSPTCFQTICSPIGGVWISDSWIGGGGEQSKPAILLQNLFGGAVENIRIGDTLCVGGWRIDDDCTIQCSSYIL